jgi:hypothetical protein
VGFNGAIDDALFGVLHEFAKEDKGKKFVLKDFRSPPLVDAKDAKVNPLHMIFNLKRVFVGKEYFKSNHLLLLPFNLARGCILLGKNVVPR